MATIIAAISLLPPQPAPSQYFLPTVINPQPIGGAGAPQWNLSGIPVLHQPIGKTYPQFWHPNPGAEITTNFTDLYYNRIHVTPPSFDAGNVSTTLNYPVEVWNSFLVPKTLTSILELEAEGINIIGGVPAGSIFGPLQNTVYTIEVTPVGPPTIAATFRWLFSADFGDHTIIGNRLVLFPFRYASPSGQGFSFLTNVLRAYDGEQRIGLRSVPREIWNLKYKVSNPSTHSQMVSAMYGRNFQPFGIPLQIYETYHYDPIPAGTTVLYLDTTKSDYRVGGLVLLYQDDIYNESKEIETINPDSLVLKRPSELDFDKGAIISPVLIMQPDGGFQWEDIGNDVNVGSIIWRSTDNVLNESTPPEEYLGYEYYNEWNLLNGSAPSSLIQPQTIIDAQTGPWDMFPLRDPVDQSMTQSSAANNPAERWALRLFIMRRMGQVNPFWVSSRRQDFVLAQTIGAGDSSMVVENMGQNYRDMKDGIFHFEMVLNDGTVFKRQIVGLSSESLDKTEQTIEFNQILGLEVLTTDVKRISYMYFVRLTTDDIDFTHEAGIYTTMTIPLITLPAPEGVIVPIEEEE